VAHRPADQVACDIDAIAGAFLELAATTPWEGLLTPMPGLNRTPLALGVDASVGIKALLKPFTSGWFHWPGNPISGETGDAAVVAYEASIVATIDDRDGLLSFMRPVAEAWRTFVSWQDGFRADPRSAVWNTTGRLTWVRLLETRGSTRLSTTGRRAVASLDYPYPSSPGRQRDATAARRLLSQRSPRCGAR
jgi:hypothetical protein